MSNENNVVDQNVVLKNRNSIFVSGILSVDSFDESLITAVTSDGTLITVEGSGLVIKDVNLEKGSFEATGNFSGVFYDTGSSVKKNGVFSKVFGRR